MLAANILGTYLAVLVALIYVLFFVYQMLFYKGWRALRKVTIGYVFI
jgi:hypothetical protein